MIFALNKNAERRKNDLVKELSPRAFWDIDINRLDYKKNYSFIIERVIVYGTEADEKLLYKIYSWHTIRNCVLKSDSLNDSLINYLSVVFDVKKEAFKCYGKIPSYVNC